MRMEDTVKERLMKIETQITNLVENISDIKGMLILMDKKHTDLENKYVTRSEYSYLKQFLAWGLGFFGTVFVVVLTWLINKIGGL
jgi:hypothetical protein